MEVHYCPHEVRKKFDEEKPDALESYDAWIKTIRIAKGDLYEVPQKQYSTEFWEYNPSSKRNMLNVVK